MTLTPFLLRLYYYKARVYDPVYGHFLQTDPIGSKADLDLYSYVGDDPVNGTDPSGLEPINVANVSSAEKDLAKAINNLMAKDGSLTVKVGGQTLTITKSEDNVSLTTSVKGASVTISGKYQNIKGAEGFRIVNPVAKTSLPGGSISASPQKGDKSAQVISVIRSGSDLYTSYKQDENLKIFGVKSFTWEHDHTVTDTKTNKTQRFIYGFGDDDD